ncbi:MAG: hypothetical protein KME45_26805 [Stenomitos rutilans HA7619-LM2]|jgi:large subunit ribosomal protein L7/L12|nr:hypothetical protein [Stenomitos rutilans HA7619-LM2]
MSGKLEKLLTKQQQLKEQIRQEKSKESQQQRKLDTRKKILAGAMVLEWINQGKFSEETLLAGLDGFLSRDQDRAVFGLPLKAATGDTELSPPKPPAKPAAPSTTNAAITQQIGSTAPTLPAPRTRLVERQEQAELEKEFF